MGKRHIWQFFGRCTKLTLILCCFLVFTSFKHQQSPRLGKRIVHYASHIIGDVPAMWKCFLLRWKACIIPQSAIPEKIEGTIPVILIHGYMHDNSAWCEFRERLEAENIGPVFTPTLSRSIDDMRDSSHEIARWIKLVKHLTGADSVILVGHSLGGIVACYAAQHLVEPGSVRAVITLGSPLHGTRVATLGVGKAAFQMQIGSPFLERLTTHIRRSPRAEYFCFGSVTDEAVRPYSSCFIKHQKYMVYDELGHTGMLFDPRVVNDVAAVIQSLHYRHEDYQPQMLVWYRKSLEQDWKKSHTSAKIAHSY